MDRTRCATCTEPERSQVHRNIDPAAVRGPWDIPHHAYVARTVPAWELNGETEAEYYARIDAEQARAERLAGVE